MEKRRDLWGFVTRALVLLTHCQTAVYSGGPHAVPAAALIATDLFCGFCLCRQISSSHHTPLLQCYRPWTAKWYVIDLDLPLAEVSLLLLSCPSPLLSLSQMPTHTFPAAYPPAVAEPSSDDKIALKFSELQSQWDALIAPVLPAAAAPSMIHLSPTAATAATVDPRAYDGRITAAVPPSAMTPTVRPFVPNSDIAGGAMGIPDSFLQPTFQYGPAAPDFDVAGSDGTRSEFQSPLPQVRATYSHARNRSRGSGSSGLAGNSLALSGPSHDVAAPKDKDSGSGNGSGSPQKFPHQTPLQTLDPFLRDKDDPTAMGKDKNNSKDKEKDKLTSSFQSLAITHESLPLLSVTLDRTPPPIAKTAVHSLDAVMTTAYSSVRYVRICDASVCRHRLT